MKMKFMLSDLDFENNLFDKIERIVQTLHDFEILLSWVRMEEYGMKMDQWKYVLWPSEVSIV